MGMPRLILLFVLVLVHATAFGLPPDNDTCPGTDVSLGDVVTGTTEDAADDYDPGEDGCTGYSAPGPDIVYHLAVASPQEVVVVLIPDDDDEYDASLYVVTNCSDITGTCEAGSDVLGPEAVSFWAGGGADYYIIVDGYTEADDGGFTLYVHGTLEVAGADTCSVEVPVICDSDERTAVSGSAAGASSDYDPGSGGCTGYAAVGPDVVYAVSLGEGGTLLAALVPDESFDAALYLVTDCSDVPGSCVAGSDDFYEGEAESITYTSQSGGLYYLIVDSFGSFGNVPGPFALAIDGDCVPPSAVEPTSWGQIKGMFR
jgi:hypothetical protein